MSLLDGQTYLVLVEKGYLIAPRALDHLLTLIFEIALFSIPVFANNDSDNNSVAIDRNPCNGEYSGNLRRRSIRLSSFNG